MTIRLLPTYIYLFMEAQNAKSFSLECTKVKLLLLNNFGYKSLKFGRLALFKKLELKLDLGARKLQKNAGV